MIFNYTEKNTAKQLIAQYDSLVGNSSLYNEIRNMHNMQKTLDLCDDYNFIDHLNYIINLKKSQGDLWNCIHNSRRRRIKKAEKEGVFIDDISNPEKLLEFYRILRETYSRARIPLADFSLFESAYCDLVPKGLAKFFFVGRDDKYCLLEHFCYTRTEFMIGMQELQMIPYQEMQMLTVFGTF